MKYRDTVTFQARLQTDMDMELNERMEYGLARARKIERTLRSWWKSQTDREHILIVSLGNLSKRRGTVNYDIELTQLHMDNELITRFQSGVEEILGVQVKRKKTDF